MAELVRPAVDTDGRWTKFDGGEKQILAACLDGYVQEIIAMASTEGAIPESERAGAAGSMLAAASLMFELDDAAGRDHPPLDVFAMTAQQIADGTFAEELKRALRERQDELVAEAQRQVDEAQDAPTGTLTPEDVTA